MHTTNLRKVGGSIMLAIPPALLDILHLRPGAKVGLAVQSGRLLVEPQQKPRYIWPSCSPSAIPRLPVARKSASGSMTSLAEASSSD